MGNKNSKQIRITRTDSLSTEIQRELLFNGYMRRLKAGGSKKKKNKKSLRINLPDGIIELCYQYYAKNMYFNKFDGIISKIHDNVEIEKLINIVSNIMKGSDDISVESKLQQKASRESQVDQAVLFGHVSQDEWMSKYKKLCDQDASSPMISMKSSQFLEQIGFVRVAKDKPVNAVMWDSVHIMKFIPANTTQKCIAAAMSILQRHKDTWDIYTHAPSGSTEKRRKFISSALKYENGISYKWELILSTLPAFSVGLAESETITPKILLDDLQSIITDESNDIPRNCIVNAIVFWMNNYWKQDFHGNMELQQQLEKYWSYYHDIHELYQVLKSSKCVKEVARQISKSAEYKESDYDITTNSVREIAEQLTLITDDIFNAIKPRELLNGNWKKESKYELAPNIVALINHFNDVSRWTQLMVLQADNHKERTRNLSWLIQLADELFMVKNLQTMMAVHSALNSNPVYMQKKCWEKLKDRDRIKHEELKVVTTHANGMKNFRKIIREAKQDSVPYAGILVQDIASFEDRRNSYSTCLGLANEIKRFQSYQNNGYWDIIPDTQIQQRILLELERDNEISDDEIYKLAKAVQKADIDQLTK